MYRWFFFIIFIVDFLAAYSQDKGLLLTMQTTDIQQIIPDGWKILSIDQGDLNSDNRDDVVFVLKPISHSVTTIQEADYRILAIYFSQKNGIYTKEFQSNSLILTKFSEQMNEPFQQVRIGDGVLEIYFQIWYADVDIPIKDHLYHFEYAKDVFVLKSYILLESHTRSGEIVEYQFDFKKEKLNIIYSSNKDGLITKQEDKKFKLKDLKTLNNIVKPFEWKFLGFNI